MTTSFPRTFNREPCPEKFLSGSVKRLSSFGVRLQIVVARHNGGHAFDGIGFVAVAGMQFEKAPG
ncbi:MAG: hypothetical protein A3G86_04985 [Gammaproteobacteria bacterium RIFCSPLOWO2_12_FULL_42_18]|nr:MAG: hypothetical protein A3B71_06755 [Gammaproteobacteria bacterium RIFCSPHIGHO2_02_FULL_42_43]OGT86679.1 MAG: hypothetical protein A3G86_04985 [Gammaproteobacteria bacterium RIFCSPLOWO2_12_FULL_42_18]